MFRTLVAAALFASLATMSLAQELAGYDRFRVAAAHRADLMLASVWYPAAGRTYRGVIGANAVFQGVSGWVGAPVPKGPHPLVVLSHGSGGTMDNVAWLSSQLAQRGAIVVAVNHPGSTSGDSSPRRSIRVWERAQDLSAVLDALLSDPEFGPRIDRDRVTALGFSLGGTTVLLSGGARLSRDAYAAYCAASPSAPDCRFWQRGGVDFEKVPQDLFEAPWTDPRLSAVIAVDPGMGYAMTDESLGAVTVPVMLVSLGDDSTLWPAVTIDADGADLVGRLPQTEHVTIAPADHFSFLALCTEQAPALLAEEGEDPICDTPKGADRATVHSRVIEAVAAFLGL